MLWIRTVKFPKRDAYLIKKSNVEIIFFCMNHWIGINCPSNLRNFKNIKYYTFFQKIKPNNLIYLTENIKLLNQILLIPIYL